ncbi:MAG: universal stress protein [Gemmatimonadales bacterium]
MSRKPVVVGVDTSPEAGWAAEVACDLAARAGADCRLVHGTREIADIPLAMPADVASAELTQHLTAAARAKVVDALGNRVPAHALERLEVRLGKSWVVLAEAVAEHRAWLLVLGGKHHTPPIRWLGASTVHHAVRTIDVPVLVTGASRHPVQRVLVALDLSSAADPTLDVAREFAGLFGASVRALHVVEPLPLLDELPVQVRYQDYVRQSEERFEEIVSAHAADGELERAVCAGIPSSVVAEVANEWNADLLVVGSHGKGWVDRMLIGSTTERLINRLPASMMVVPVPAPTERSGRPGANPNDPGDA